MATSVTSVLEVPTPKKSNHQVNIVRVAELLPHTNADSLELINIGGYQVVVKKGQFTVSDLAVYIQPDSVVPQTMPFAFIWERFTQPDYTPDSTALVPEKRRRITVRKFRGEWSEGLLLPIADFPELTKHNGLIDVYTPDFTEGTDVSDLLGITHYDPDKGTESTSGENMSGPRRVNRPHYRPRTVKGWFFYLLRKLGLRRDERYHSEVIDFEAPVYDVEAYKNHKDAIQDGEIIEVTEKIHGSNARYVFLDGKMYAGSRNLWKSPTSNCVWRKALVQNPWIQVICEANPGYILYGEITPTQKGFDYGNQTGSVRFFLFDIRTPEGEWLTRTEYVNLKGADLVDWKQAQVPEFYSGPFNDGLIKQFVDGPSLVAGANHIKEGIVVRPVTERRVPGLGRPQLKIVSNAFLLKDSK